MIGGWRQAGAILALPGTVTVVVPAVIVWLTGGGGLPPSWPARVAGGVLVLGGLLLWGWTVAFFMTAGRGTLAPWDPPRRLVVRGIYRHLRNPMITAVCSLLLGEAAIFGSAALLGWFALFLIANLVYIPRREEPDLVRRFGAEYEEYRRRVPRWIPRLRPWSPSLPTTERTGRP